MSDVEKFWNAIAAKMNAPQYSELPQWHQIMVVQAVNLLLSVASEHEE